MIKEYEEKIKLHGCLYGELGHPDTFDISLSNASHIITGMKLKYPNNFFCLWRTELKLKK